MDLIKNTDPAKADTNSYPIATVHNDADGNVATLILQLEDGRMFAAKADEKLDFKGSDVLKSSTATLRSDGLNADGVPLNPVVTAITRKPD